MACQHYDWLTRQPGAQVSHLLDSALILVPAAFDGAAMAALSRAAATDLRLAQAAEHAEDGRSLSTWRVVPRC